jgi:peptidoglycan/LPS O-acetylase OafA/YrhL
MGFIRVILALSVVIGHYNMLKPHSVINLALPGGRLAVLCFYVISGYYMALILSSKYRVPGGVKLFYLARAIRLWPIYLAVLLLVLPFNLLGVLNDFSNSFKPLSLPLKTWAVFSNIFIIGQDIFAPFGLDGHGGILYAPFDTPQGDAWKLLLNMPAYTISTEIMFYILAPFIVVRLRNCAIAMVLGSAYHIALSAAGKTGAADHFYFLPAALIYFSLGAAVYLISREGFRLDKPGYYVSALLLTTLLLCTPLCIPLLGVPGGMPSYFILAFAVSIPFIFSLTKRLTFDRSLGDLSYIIYLVHWNALLLMRHYFGEDVSGLYVVIVVIAVSVILNYLVEKPVEKFRARLMGRLLEKQVGKASAV